VLVIFARNPVHSVLWLILAFFNAAGLMLLVGAEFIAMLLVIVYVGAVAVLFLFVVMMLDIDFSQLRSGFNRNLPFGLLIAIVLLAEIVIAMSAYKAGPAMAGRTGPAGCAEHRGARGRALQPLPAAVRTGRLHPAGGDDRRDRAYPSQPRRRARAECQPPDRPPPAGRRSQRQPARRRGDRAVIGLAHYLTVSAILFVIGVLGIFLNRRNVILMLMAIELLLLSVNINLVAFSAYLGDMKGQIFAMFVLTVAAAEAAIGLAILVIFFRRRGTIAVDAADQMRG
jgi:NADH:ubiquinone oxidoreductase subunit K